MTTTPGSPTPSPTPQPTPAAVSSSATSPGGVNVAPAADEEVIFYEGSPKLRGELLMLGQCFLVGGLLIAVPIVWGAATGNWWTVPWWAWVGFVGLGLGSILLPALLVRRHRFRISNYRIDFEQGLLSRKIDTIELWHVNDVQMFQSLVDRVMRVGTITVHSDDATNRQLKLRSLPDPRRLYDAIKQRVIAVKRQRGVIKFDHGAGVDATTS